MYTVLDSPDVFRIEERAQHEVDEEAPIGSKATIWQAHVRQGAEIWWFLFRWTASGHVFFADMIRSLMVFIPSSFSSPKDVGAEKSLRCHTYSSFQEACVPQERRCINGTSDTKGDERVGVECIVAAQSRQIIGSGCN